MSLAEKIQGTPRKRQGPRKANRQAAEPSKQPLVTEPRKKPKTTEECFENPLIKVDENGKVLINRLPEYWSGRLREE